MLKHKHWLAILLLICTTVAMAQSGSSIRGTVTDPQGNVLPNATVTLTNPATGSVRTQTSNAQGLFAFEQVQPGDYRLEVKASGFDAVTTNVRALVGRNVDAPVSMAVGAVAEVVSVEGTVETINTQDASLGNNFNSIQISQLPMEARNVGALLTLQPGVTREGYVAGARSDQSNITLDGVDINNAQSNSLEGPALRLNSESIEEFRVNTMNANADQGRSSAAQISLVTKSGTNDWHGSAYEFHRNTIFTANDYFNNLAGAERSKLLRNTFGGSLGGPIQKNKMFFFYNYEGRRDAAQTPVTRVVPLPSLGQGQLKYLDANDQVQTLSLGQLNQIYNVVGINPAAMTALAAAASKYPANDFSVGDGLNTAGFRFNANAPVNMNAHVLRFDYNASTNHQFFARTQVQHDMFGREQRFPDTFAPSDWSHPWGVALGHTWTVSNNIVNNFRYGVTRQAFTNQGDSEANAVYFRFVFQPLNFDRTVARITPVHNFANDLSWMKGNHTIQFGTNIRLIRNSRYSFGSAYDTAVTNPSFYSGSGSSVSNPVRNYLAANGLPAMDSSSVSNVQNAATALIGRFSQYTARFTFDLDGGLLPSGTPTDRKFATEEYDFYIQDTWRWRRNLTVTAGLRYGLSRPVYETHGYELKPNVALSDYFDRRVAAMAKGEYYAEDIVMQRSGPANNASPLYTWDKNNFQPRVAIAWSPGFAKESFFGRLLGGEGSSVVRGGFGITNDYYGQALAVAFDLNNAVGFTSEQTIAANTFNVTTRPAPQYTGFGQAVRPMPRITPPSEIVLQQPADMARRIESSLDERIKAPTHYMFNLTYERELPAGMLFQTSYMGRLGRNLLAQRDVMAPANLYDPVSKMDWYTATTILEKARQAGAPSVPDLPYFENMFPGLSQLLADDGWGNDGLSNTASIYYMVKDLELGNDWTYIQDNIDFYTGVPYFYQPQYGALSSWATVANSNYHGMVISMRQRTSLVSWDFNYTFSHSLDDASGLQAADEYDTASFIMNPLRQRDNYASSDFDIRHIINFNSMVQLPFGRGKWLGSSVGNGWNSVIGGWSISNIFRWNTGLPIFAPYDDARWATNWNAQSFGTATKPVKACPTRGETPKLFGCNTVAAYQSYRNAYPGETGQRNSLRMPGYVVLDMGIGKAFDMPYAENHKLQFRWDIFNLTNTQRFGAVDTSRSGFGIGLDPATSEPPSNWSNFTGIQGTPRVMQVGLRYSF